MRMSCLLSATLSLLAAPALADEMVDMRPGLMCVSPESLAKLTLPDGSSRTARAGATAEDLRIKDAGGCIDIPPGAKVLVMTKRRNTSIVSFNADVGKGVETFIVPNIDFADGSPSPSSSSSSSPGRGQVANSSIALIPKAPAGSPAALSLPIPMPVQPAREIGDCPAAYTSNGRRPEALVCVCTAASLTQGSVIGTDLYGFDSSLCLAARHAGIITAAGGTAAFFQVLGPLVLTGSLRNGVDSGAQQSSDGAFQVRTATPMIVDYIRRLSDRDAAAESAPSIRMSDGELLVPEQVPPAAFLDLKSDLPAGGVTILMPAPNELALPIPPPALSPLSR